VAVTACAADIRHGFSHCFQFMPQNITCASTCNLPGFRYSVKRSAGIYRAIGNHRYARYLRGTTREQKDDESGDDKFNIREKERFVSSQLKDSSYLQKSSTTEKCFTRNIPPRYLIDISNDLLTRFANTELEWKHGGNDVCYYNN